MCEDRPLDYERGADAGADVEVPDEADSDKIGNTNLAPVRPVSVQSPVTYKRFTCPQRFQPLGERDWGAWAEGRQ